MYSSGIPIFAGRHLKVGISRAWKMEEWAVGSLSSVPLVISLNACSDASFNWTLNIERQPLCPDGWEDTQSVSSSAQRLPGKCACFSGWSWEDSKIPNLDDVFSRSVYGRPRNKEPFYAEHIVNLVSFWTIAIFAVFILPTEYPLNVLWARSRNSTSHWHRFRATVNA